jgi:hypothetical protein
LLDKGARPDNDAAMNTDDLKPKIPRGETRRLFGTALLVLGLLCLLLGGRAWDGVATPCLNLGAVLLIWGSILGWLRVLEDRQIAIQRRLPGNDQPPG